MTAKRLAEFSFSLVLSLTSLLVISVPTAYATQFLTETTAKRLFYNPFVTMGITFIATLLMIVIARHYNRLNAKR